MRTKEIELPVCDPLHNYDDYALGPIGYHDALVLGAIARYVAKANILEFGCEEGFSSRVWIESGAAHLTCVDVSVREGVWRLFRQYPGRVTIAEKPQQEFHPSSNYDIVFFDASHSFDVNVQTYRNIEHGLSPECLIIIHDTGLWCPHKMTKHHSDFAMDRKKPWIDGGVEHQPEERQFVRWLGAIGWSCVNLGSRSELRHGLTICQRSTL